MNGQTEMVRFPLDRNAPIDEFVIEVDASNGHIEIVKQLREYGAPK